MKRQTFLIAALLIAVPATSAASPDFNAVELVQWLTGETAFEPVVINTLVDDGNGVCRGQFGIETPLMPPNAIATVSVDFDGCTVVSMTAIAVPNPEMLEMPKVSTTYYATAVAKNEMTSASGSSSSTNPMKYTYNLASASAYSSGASCSVSGSWRTDGCTPSWISCCSGSYVEGQSDHYSHSIFWPPAYHHEYARAKGWYNGVNQWWCNSEDLPGTIDTWTCTGWQNPYW